jgi:L-2-hydroxyglutarate oxidase LhgO
MLLWGAAYYVRYVKRDANDCLCTTWFVVAAGCGTSALAATTQIRTDTTQHVIHIKIYILAQMYHKRQHRLIYVHIPHIYKVLK